MGCTRRLLPIHKASIHRSGGAKKKVRGAGEQSGARIHSSDRILPPKTAAPDFLHATLNWSAHAAFFFKESRTGLFSSTRLHRKSGRAYEMHDSPQNSGGSPHVTFIRVESTLG